MLTPITPARRLAQAIETRAIEAQLIRRLVDLADDVADGVTNGEGPHRERRREELSAVLRGASAMLGDLVEELGRLEDLALALQDAPRAPSAPQMPAAA